MARALINRLGAMVTDTSLPILCRDRILQGANGGVLHDFDLAYAYSWPGAVPVNGAAITDVAGVANGSIALASSGLTSLGGGIDFSGVTAPGATIEVPPNFATSIWGTGTSDQFPLIVLYVRLPTLADWATSGTKPFLTFTTNSNGLTGEPDLLTIGQVSGGIIRAVRPTNGTTGTFENFSITPAPADYGTVVQLMFYRNATGQIFRLKSANGVVQAGKVVGVNNPVSFAGKTGHIGIGTALWTAPLGTPKNWRAYRGVFENLLVSGRDPTTVADADYARVTGLRGNPFS